MKNLTLLNCRRLPARITLEQVALLLGFPVDEILNLEKIMTVTCFDGASPD
jgi:hypothetical protein